MKVSSKTKTKISRAKDNKLVVFGVIIVMAVIGTAALLTTRAATTSFEAESGSVNRSPNVTVAPDSAASGGSYAKFSATQSGGTGGAVQRFPGDPNPRVTGKTYWGANVYALMPDGSKNSDVYNRHEKPAGTSLALHHRYFQWSNVTSNSASSVVNAARTDHNANRLPYVTFKTNDSWAAMGNGTHDASIDALLRGLDSLGKPVWLTAWHEPENDTNGGTRTANTWKAMQTRIRQRMNAVGTKNIAFMPHFMGGSTRNDNGASYDIEKWWLDGDIWDVVMFSNYCQRDCVDKGGNTFDMGERTSSIKFLESKGVPWGVGEWSLSERTTGPLKFTKYFMPYFEQGFKGDGTKPYDAVAYSYFDADESRPDGSSPYYASLRDANLDEFHRIMRDPRVMKLDQLGTNTGGSSNYGTITSNVSIPTTGNYKVWVRMSAPDTTNNAVNLQIDNGTAVKVGDGGIAANSWTWVDWKNGSTTNKNTFNLAAGSRQIKLTGIEPNVKIDRIIVADDACTQPTGTGDNCTVVAPQPQIAITSPTSNQTVQGTVAVNAEPATGISQVVFLLNGQQRSTDSSAPFSWNWDTTTIANGQATVTIRASGPGVTTGSYIEKTVTVNVQNNTTQPPTKQCDFNGDNIIGLADLSKLLSNYGRSVTPNTEGDCTGDGLVGLVDLSALLSRYGK